MTIKKKYHSYGFTLIELAIGLMIVGLLMSGFFSMATVTMGNKKQNMTTENLKKSQLALQAYLEINGFYPCPAPRMVKRGESGFGRALTSCFPSTGVVTHDDGTLDVPGARVKQDDNTTPSRVRIGILPFRSLGLSDAEAVDGWGNQLQYAVTTRLTTFDSFDAKQGTIDVLADDGGSRLSPPASIQYVIFSTGADGKGGYSSDGVPLDPCPQTGLERHNCDGDAVFMDAQVQAAHLEKNAPIAGYDDKISYQQLTPGTKGGLLFFYEGQCQSGFSEVSIKPNDVNGIDVLRRDVVDEIDNSAVKKLCFSSHYSSFFLLSASSGGKPTRCPSGWSGIGFKLFGDADYLAGYRVCAR